MSAFTFAYGSATDVGRVREQNQDALIVGPRVFVVADGMGGQAAGEVASAVAVRRFGDALAARPGPPTSPADLADAVQAANDGILAAVDEDVDRLGMGTTLTGCGLAEVDGAPAMMVFNIGDSRVYRRSGPDFAQVTVDHSEVQELLAAGVLDRATAAVYPRRNIITRSLGTPDVPVADTWVFPIVVGDRYLVCSDGLTNELTEDRIRILLDEFSEPQAAAEALVTGAVDAGGRDNVTVVVVDLVPAEPQPSTSG